MLQVRALVIGDTRMTDDEPVYRFAAELLASGRLTVPSEPDRLFFDRAFMVNDGRYYGCYFLGWPFLMLPGLLLGVEGYANAVYAGLTVPALFLAARRLGGGGVARVAVVLFIASPMMMIGSATLLAHASCLAANSWALWLFLRTRDDACPLRVHAAFGFAVAAAFFIRPQTTVALAVPLAILWLASLRRVDDRARRLAAFGVPTAALAALFLWINDATTGSPFYPPYQRLLDYLVENSFRFGHIGSAMDMTVVGLNFEPQSALAILGSGLFRLNFALFGWPSSFLFLLPAVGAQRSRVPWVMFWTYVATHFFQIDNGIDAFGPVHFYEMALPVILLSALGAGRAHRWLLHHARASGAERSRASSSRSS